MNKSSRLFLWIFLVGALALQAQTTLAVSRFENHTGKMKYDGWERAFAALMRLHLGNNEEVLILDRSRMEPLLKEQALSQSGLLDSVRSIGHLLGADFIVSGSLEWDNGLLIVTADMIRVKTGQLITEQVSARGHRDRMAAVLAHNLLYRLGLEETYRTGDRVLSNDVWYWSGAFALSGAAALYFDRRYKEQYSLYRETGSLAEFDNYYNNANNSRTWSYILGGAALVSLSGALIRWFKSDSENVIRAGGRLKTETSLYMVPNETFNLGLVIHF